MGLYEDSSTSIQAMDLLPDTQNCGLRISLNEKLSIFIQIALKFVPRDPVSKNSALVQVMAWHRSDDKSLYEPMVVYLTDACMRHSVSLS